MPKRWRPLHEASLPLLPDDVMGAWGVLQHGCFSLEKNIVSGMEFLVDKGFFAGNNMPRIAEVAELADARDSKSRPGNGVRVRVPPSAFFILFPFAATARISGGFLIKKARQERSIVLCYVLLHIPAKKRCNLL